MTRYNYQPTQGGKQVLLFDMDGILADFNKYSLMVYNQMFKTNYDLNRVNEYIGDHEVINKNIDARELRKPFREPGSFINLPVFPGAQEAVALLEKQFDIYVVTTQYYGNPTCVHEKHVWLQRHFPSIANKGIFTRHKYMVRGDMLIDDRASNLSEWLDHNPNGSTASLLYPWTDLTATHVAKPTWEELAPAIVKHFEQEELND